MFCSKRTRTSNWALGGFGFSLHAIPSLNYNWLLAAAAAILLIASNAAVSAQHADDLVSTPRQLPPSAAEAAAPDAAAPAAAEVPLSPGFADKITIGLNMEISRFSTDSGFIPPDTMGAVGPDHIVEIINGNFEIFNKRTGASVETHSLDDFWTNIVRGVTIPAFNDVCNLATNMCTVSGNMCMTDLQCVRNFTFDPRIIFDPASGRWFAVSIDAENPATGDNNIYVARSATDDPRDDWDGVRFAADTIGNPEFHDYPTLGVDTDGLYICTQDFAGTINVNESCYSIPKADLLLATPSIANMTRFEATPAGLPRVNGSIQPALDFGPTDGRAALLGSTGTALRRSNIFGAGFAGAMLGTPVPITGDPGHQMPPDARQPHPSDPAVTIENVAPRFVGNVFEQGDSLWAAHAVLGNNNNSAIRWYEIDEVTNIVLQTGLIEDPNQDFHEPSIAVNEFGNVVIGYTCSGPNLAASACVSVGETVSGVTTFETPQILALGAGHYYRDMCTPTPQNPCMERNRWGDYSATVIDPVDPCTFWTFQEFVAVSAVDNVGPGRAEGGNWGTQVTELTFNSCVPSLRAELSLQKQADRTVSLGDRLTYTISVRNAGPATATGVMITDQLPANVKFVSASPECRHSDGTVTCEIDDLERGGRARLLITVQVASPGEIINTATVAANEIDRHPSNNTDTAVTTVR
jgi:uncharacterized repeat protein (TIGR01451 family)